MQPPSGPGTAAPAADMFARHRWFLISALGGILVAGFFLVRAASDESVYYLYAHEATETRDQFPDGRIFRLAGRVVSGTVAREPGAVVFDVSDGLATVPVRLESTPPELFDEGVEVLLEGSWQDGRFAAYEALIRHAAEYEAPAEGNGLSG